MKVFNACIKIIRRNWPSFALYIIIFSALLVLFSTLSGQKKQLSFEAEKPKISIIQRDTDSALTDGLFRVLREKATEISLLDERDVLLDAVFFGEVDYILIIPEGFSESFLNGKDSTLEKLLPLGATDVFLLDSYIDQYMKTYRLYQEAFPSMEAKTISDKAFAQVTISAEVELKSFSNSGPFPTGLHVSFSTLLYPILAVCILLISNIFMSFEKPELRMRNLASPISLKSQNLQKVFASLLLCLSLLVILLILIFCVNADAIRTLDIRITGLLILNSFLILLVAVSISFLAGFFIKSSNVQSAVGNIVSLGMSFICGAFVPLELLEENVKNIARFLPGYWYIITIDNLRDLTHITAENLRPIWTAMLIQFGFAIAITAIALALSKAMQQSESAYGRTMTQRR